MIKWGYSAAALASFALLACRQAPEQEATPQPTAQASQAIPPLPIAEPPLDREALLIATLHAASAAASGGDDREAQRVLDGKRFELRSRFGCSGESEDESRTRRWTFDEKRHVLRIRVAPEITASSAVLASLGAGAYEAAEGFWIPQPWLLTAACPVALPPVPTAAPSEPAKGMASDAPSPRPAPPAPPSPRLALVQFFTAQDRRTHRRNDRAYEVTKTLAAGAAASTRGYDLVVAGRLKRVADGRVIVCAGQGALAPPLCAISAEFDRVALANPETGEVLAEWGGA